MNLIEVALHRSQRIQSSHSLAMVSGCIDDKLSLMCVIMCDLVLSNSLLKVPTTQK